MRKYCVYKSRKYNMIIDWHRLYCIQAKLHHPWQKNEAELYVQEYIIKERLSNSNMGHQK